MANLQNPGDVKHLSFSTWNYVPDAHAKIWVVRLRSASDRLEVPILSSTHAVTSLTSPVTVKFYSATSTAASLEITGGHAGLDAVFVTLHADYADRRQT